MSPDNAAENENENENENRNQSENQNGNGTALQPPTSGSPPTRRSLWIGLVVLGSTLIVAVVVALVWWGGQGFPGVRGTTGTSTPSTTATPETTGPPVTSAPTASASPTPAPTQSATAAPGQTAAPGVPRPTSCTQLYSPDMVQALGDLTLNPAWSQDSDSGVSHGTDDAELRAQIDSLGHLTCVWASPYRGSDTGIITTVVWVTPEQTVAVEARLVANGLECFTQSEGRRCVIQTTRQTALSVSATF